METERIEWKDLQREMRKREVALELEKAKSFMERLKKVLEANGYPDIIELLDRAMKYM